MTFPPDSERPDLSVNAVKFSARNLFKALSQLPFGGPFPRIGKYLGENQVMVPDKVLPKTVNHTQPDVKKGDKIIIFTQGARPRE